MFKNHFEGYKVIFKIESIDSQGNKKLVPLLDENGMCTNSYANGCFWVNSTFRVNGPNFDIKTYEKGIIPYLNYFATKNSVNPIKYVFYVNEIQPREECQKDFLKNQIAKPWKEVGEAVVEKNTFIFKWNEQMEQILENE